MRLPTWWPLAWFAVAVLVAGTVDYHGAHAGPSDTPGPLPQVVIPPPIPMSQDERIASALLRASERHGIPVGLLACIAWQESHWDPRARGALGERGLVQLLPDGGLLRDFLEAGFTDPENPEQAAEYLAGWLARDSAFVARNWTGYRRCM